MDGPVRADDEADPVDEPLPNKNVHRRQGLVDLEARRIGGNAMGGGGANADGDISAHRVAHGLQDLGGDPHAVL